MSAAKVLLAILALSGCAIHPIDTPTMTPEQCRMYGVAVHDSDWPPTGTVVEVIRGTFATVEKYCGEYYGQYLNGCARAVEGKFFPSPSHQYIVVTAEFDRDCVLRHELCHARHEQRGHVVSFNLRAMQGDQFAACPQGD